MSFYKFIRGLLMVLTKIFFRVQTVGEENIPQSGSYIFCANHISFLDPILIACTKKREFHFLAKEELVRIPVLGFIIKKLNVIPIKRGAGDLGAMRKGIEVLKDGNALIMFPEGTRSKTGEIGEAKNGVSLLVKRSVCGVVPCAVIGKPRLFRRTKLVYGKPIDALIFECEKDAKHITTVVMDNIIKLIDENK